MAGGRYERGGGLGGSEHPELIKGGERLPWLETDDEEEYAANFAASRVAPLGIMVLLLMAALAGGLWYMLKGNADEPPADGSLIAAPDEPYKTRPDDPGGKVFAGTGDTSFAVGEGQQREGQLAEKPSVMGMPIPSVSEETKPADAPPAPAVVAGGVGVQVGAFPRREDAEAAWARLLRQTEALSGVRHRIVAAQVDIGTVYRLQAVAGDRASAIRLCNALKADGLPCSVK